jgi:thiol-disulfide isomerase/thioredoxin
VRQKESHRRGLDSGRGAGESLLATRAPLRSLWAAATLAIALLLARPSSAGDTLNVQDWLSQPGVRLVVVEFYATWCKPCMDAMPRWKALKERYASQGLRIVVVNTQDPDMACRALPFVPDETVCDLSGRVADRFNVQGKLPSAFLWSWQGNVLVAKGHIDEVEKAVERYMAEAPRVVIEAGKDVSPVVTNEVRERLTEDGKVIVLAGAAEQAAIEAAKKAAQGARYDEKLNCEIGKEVPPNALLKVNKVSQAGASTFLNVGLYDLKTGCLLASASSEWQSDLRRLTQDATGKLLRKLKRQEGHQMPTAIAGEVVVKQRSDRIINPEDRNWKPKTDDPSLVIFESTPPGARVEVDGVVKCEVTPCRKMLDSGLRVVRMSLAKFDAREEAVRVDGEQKLQWSLAKSETTVTFQSQPQGVAVEVDGAAVCVKTPCSADVTPGKHRVRMSGERLVAKEEKIAIQGDRQTVAWTLEANTAMVRVETGIEGVPIRIDGEPSGRSPVALDLEAGPHRIAIADACFEEARADVTVERGKPKTITMKAVRKMAGLRVELSDRDGDPAEGDVKLDGQSVGRTWKTLEVPACGKEIEVASGGTTWRKTVELKAFETTKLAGELPDAKKKAIAPPPPPAPVPAKPVEPAQASAATWKRSAGMWTLGVGGLSVALGATFAVLAKSAGDEVTAKHEACVRSGAASCEGLVAEAESARLQSNLGLTGLYLGGALSALGAYWFFTAPSEEKPRALELRVGPTSLAVGGSF